MITIMVMSGVDDGMVINLDPNSDGQLVGGDWLLKIGRRDESDITLRNDSFVSRDHAQLRLSDGVWTLTDNESKNGSFLETVDEDIQIRGQVTLRVGQLFRIGRTWLRLQATE